MFKNQIYQKNEEIPCFLKKYIFSTRTYVVESVYDHVTGYLRVPSHPKINGILRQAYEQKLIVPLRFKCLYEDKLQFFYKLETVSDSQQNDISTSIEEPVTNVSTTEDDMIVSGAETLEIVFSTKNVEYNNTLIQTLVTSLGDKIDTPEKYDLAVNIIAINKKLKIDKNLYRTIFNKASIKYQTQLWKDDILPYCSNGMVKHAWTEADEDGRKAILQRLGITLDGMRNNEQVINTKHTKTCINNSTKQIQQIEQEASLSAINERKNRQNTLNKRQQTLVQHSDELNTQRAAIHRQQKNYVANTAIRIAQAQTQNERQTIEQESKREEKRFQEQLREVDNQQTTITQQIEEVSNEISQTQQEIQTIRDTSEITTIGGRGKLKINLKWQTTDDVDLHVYDPDNNHIYYGDRTAVCQGAKGQLDVDANAGSPITTSPQENIFWDDKAPIGHYKVDVNMYNKRSNISDVSFAVTIIPELGQAKTFTGVLKRNQQTIRLVEFKYTDNGIIYL